MPVNRVVIFHGRIIMYVLIELSSSMKELFVRIVIFHKAIICAC